MGASKQDELSAPLLSSDERGAAQDVTIDMSHLEQRTRQEGLLRMMHGVVRGDSKKKAIDGFTRLIEAGLATVVVQANSGWIALDGIVVANHKDEEGVDDKIEDASNKLNHFSTYLGIFAPLALFAIYKHNAQNALREERADAAIKDYLPATGLEAPSPSTTSDTTPQPAQPEITEYLADTLSKTASKHGIPVNQDNLSKLAAISALENNSHYRITSERLFVGVFETVGSTVSNLLGSLTNDGFITGHVNAEALLGLISKEEQVTSVSLNDAKAAFKDKDNELRFDETVINKALELIDKAKELENKEKPSANAGLMSKTYETANTLLCEGADMFRKWMVLDRDPSLLAMDKDKGDKQPNSGTHVTRVQHAARTLGEDRRL